MTKVFSTRKENMEYNDYYTQKSVKNVDSVEIIDEWAILYTPKTSKVITRTACSSPKQSKLL